MRNGFVEDDKIRVASILPEREEDGPGLRTVCFFQGCNQGCRECHNPHTWNIENGISMSVQELAEEIFKIKNPFKRVTISGGEPLLQVKGLKELVDILYKEGYEIALYTSFELEEVPIEIRKKLTYLKTGRFIIEKKVEGKFYGSSNQKFFKLKGEEIIYEE